MGSKLNILNNGKIQRTLANTKGGLLVYDEDVIIFKSCIIEDKELDVILEISDIPIKPRDFFSLHETFDYSHWIVCNPKQSIKYVDLDKVINYKDFNELRYAISRESLKLSKN